MSILKEAEAVDYGVVLAGSVLILIPAILVFIIGQRYLVRGMTAGAVKG
jgi:sn-glycerol 3-phosphate transport system permease protein